MRKRISKLILGLGMAGLLVFLSACGQEGTKTGEKNPEKKVIVGTDAAYAPFTYMDKGKIVGFDIDIVDAIMKEAGYEYEVKNIGWDALFESTRQADQIDLAVCAITISDDRKQTYDFSSPYYQSTHMIMTNKSNPVKSANDLKGLTVGVLNGSTGQMAAEQILGKNSPDIKKYESDAVSIMSLKNGAVAAVIADNTVINEYLKNNPNEQFKTLEDHKNFNAEFYGLMLPKDSELTSKVDKALKKIIENGTYSKIYEKWLGTEPDIKALQAAQ
ncbi:basic amino acid ABC transporter substrate-binding protein [Pseudobacillus wudalianchiensis]|uniref:Glutamine ABC transporter substrate-binding protein n=1 Tax=Pseudobacillus wudalianchiensis TaxID=1743143 RepID=A0A1B9B7W7_9BACI|nr:basic amino acid ABC transporter substrate-binding protein [Bacillus wudalianchiensis]OCA92194.1 glutamine ABC transporter substrate-binding protein [Bacillus wudalianchiensis]